MASRLDVSYTSMPNWPFSGSSTNPLRIAILDSSFNPPSRAHASIAVYEASSYNAHLLLLSSVNVDKVSKEGETSLAQRLDMMTLLAKGLVRDFKGCKNFAVGSLAAATFAEKAPIVLTYIHNHFDSWQPSITPRTSVLPKPTLVFFIGFDTVTRLFMQKYYGNSEKEMERSMTNFFERDGCEIVCARRAVADVAQKDVANQEEVELFSRPFVSRLLFEGKMRVVDIPGTGGISSTSIRSILQEQTNSEDMEEKLQYLAFPETIDYCMQNSLYKRKN